MHQHPCPHHLRQRSVQKQDQASEEISPEEIQGLHVINVSPSVRQEFHRRAHHRHSVVCCKEDQHRHLLCRKTVLHQSHRQDQGCLLQDTGSERTDFTKQKRFLQGVLSRRGSQQEQRQSADGRKLQHGSRSIVPCRRSVPFSFFAVGLVGGWC